MVHIDESRLFFRELVKYYNSCPECYSRNITTLYNEIDGGMVLNKRTKKAVDKGDLDFRIHKSCLYCVQCNYYDFPDAFREREIKLYPIDQFEYNEVYDILRMKYVSYLRKKFSLNDPRLDAYRVQEKES